MEEVKEHEHLYNNFCTFSTFHFSQNLLVPQNNVLLAIVSLLLNKLQQGQGLLFGPSPAGPRVWERWDDRAITI